MIDIKKEMEKTVDHPIPYLIDLYNICVVTNMVNIQKKCICGKFQVKR